LGLTMTGAGGGGKSGAAATAPLARLVIDARAIIRKHAEAAAVEAGLGAGSGVDAGAAPPG
jgi:hypothetical protein